MGHANYIGKYNLGRTIGEGTFAKVKLGVDTTNGQHVAIKIIDKHMVLETDLKCQVQREITTMKLLHHPNIVRIYEVIGTKKKIYIVMEYVSGGQLSDKLSYVKKLNEPEARKIFQQLIDAVDYCHNRGVYHRDLKPDNLLLESQGNLKVSDFGLSALRKPGDILTTACGSPCYVAPELLANKGYDGAAADVWSCGVILFELLAGYLPFDDRNLMVLYRKIARAEYKFPRWFTEGQKNLISRILNPNPKMRITLLEITEDSWFQTDYEPSCGYQSDDKIYLDDVNAAFDSIEENDSESKMPKSPSFINAFQLIAMSHDLDLSGLFEGQDDMKTTTRLGSKLPVTETFKKIEAAAMDVSLSIERMNKFKIKMHPKLDQKMTRCSRSYYDLSAEVIEVAPTNCVIEISKSAGELRVYKEFCKSLSSLLTENSDASPQVQDSKEVRVTSRSTQNIECSEDKNYVHNKDNRGYSSS
ncbi:CBL-interacting serine/threonine-protein kinase 21-like [Mangifera indica]|uniref:CBL-interacting serine/threonine-protein kinase 21-like n=1 Tax=Mangifera indica TaxID=29780 RepID=UPI001CFBDB2B|nr:CBL-interacting serine/threonine-protein kinase 21-like [Mangifera indica]